MMTRRVQWVPGGGRETLTTKETEELFGDVNRLYLNYGSGYMHTHVKFINEINFIVCKLFPNKPN